MPFDKFNLKIFLFLLLSGLIFNCQSQDILIIDCPDSLNFLEFNYVLRVGENYNSPLDGYSTNEWVISKSGERKEFQLLNKKDALPRWIRIVFLIYKNDDRTNFGFTHVHEVVVASDKLTHVWISPFNGDEMSEGYIKEFSLEEAIASLDKQRTLIVKAPELFNKERFDFSLNVSWNDSESVTYTDKSTARRLIEDEQREEYKIVKRKDSTLNISFTVRELKTGNRFTTDTVGLALTEDTNFFIAPPLKEDEVKTYFSDLSKTRRRNNLNYIGEVIKQFPKDWESRVLYASFYQGHRSYGELLFGIARYTKESTLRHLFRRNRPEIPSIISGPAIGAEFNFNWSKNNFILGPKIGAQVSLRILNAGIHAVYYTDFTKGVVYLKPRVGINFGSPFVNLSYAYAIRLGPNYFGDRVNQHQLCINGIIPLKLKEW